MTTETHTLVDDGALFGATTTPAPVRCCDSWDEGRRLPEYALGGHVHCTCGAVSGHLATKAARKSWLDSHRHQRRIADEARRRERHAAERETEERVNQARIRAEGYADRNIREYVARLDRLYAELIRRGHATDLVPDTWTADHPDLADEAAMRAGWPEEVALAARCRDLEKVAADARAETERQIAWRIDAEKSRAEWMRTACSLEPDERVRYELIRARLADSDPGFQHEHHARVEELERQRREVGEKAGVEIREWRGRAEALASFVRTLTKLPTRPAKIGRRHLTAVAWAIAPRRRFEIEGVADPAALPAEVVSEVCRRAVEQQIADIIANARIYDIGGLDGAEKDRVTTWADGYRQKSLEALGFEGSVS